jgi:PKD repeat protein
MLKRVITHLGLLYTIFAVWGCKPADPVVPTPTPTAPVPSFSVTLSSPYAPSVATFTNITIGDGVSYQWDFGDGGGSTSKNTTHTYTAVGTYTVKLVAVNGGGTREVTKVITLNVLPAPTPAIFTNGSNFMMYDNIAFTNKTPYRNSYTYNWNFGDGETSQSSDSLVTHSFNTAGNYNVVLTATHPITGLSQQVSKNITVTSPPIPPRVAVQRIDVESLPYSSVYGAGFTFYQYSSSYLTDFAYTTTTVKSLPINITSTNTNYYANSPYSQHSLDLYYSTCNGCSRSNQYRFTLRPSDYPPASGTNISSVVLTSGLNRIKVYLDWSN